MSVPKPILITGATGKQGGAVLKHLATHPSSSQFLLLAVTRNSSSASAQKLKENYSNVLLVQGDLDDAAALFKNAEATLKESGGAAKAEKIWGVFSVQISMGTGVTIETEIKQGTTLIDEALAHGVKHFVYSSVDRGGNEKSFKDPTPVPHFQSKFKIEEHLLQKAGAKGENMPWTILRPVAFMDNLAPGLPAKIFLSSLRDTLEEKPLQWISVDDIGRFAAKAFREPDAWNARAEGLAGDELSFAEVSKCFERVTGSPAPTTFGFLGSLFKWGVKEMGVMINWFKTDGYGADIAKLRQEEPELCGFERWLRETSGWKDSAITK